MIKKKTVQDIISKKRIVLDGQNIQVDSMSDMEILMTLLEALGDQAKQIPKRHECKPEDNCPINGICDTIEMAMVVIQAKLAMVAIQQKLKQ